MGHINVEKIAEMILGLFEGFHNWIDWRLFTYLNFDDDILFD